MAQLPWNHHLAPLFAFGVLALGGGWALHNASDSAADQLYQGQLAACDRGNVLRAESNRRVESMTVVKDSLKDFLTSARTARLTAYEAEQNKFDKLAADDYTRLIQKIEDQVKFEFVPLVDCAQVVEKP